MLVIEMLEDYDGAGRNIMMFDSRWSACSAVLFKINIDIYKPNIYISQCPLSTRTVSRCDDKDNNQMFAYPIRHLLTIDFAI